MSKNIPTFPSLETQTRQGKSKYAKEYRLKIVEQLLDSKLDVSIEDLAEIHNVNVGTIASWRTQYNKQRNKKTDISEISDMDSIIQAYKNEIKNTDKLLKIIDDEVAQAQQVIDNAEDRKADILARKERLEQLLASSKELRL